MKKNTKIILFIAFLICILLVFLDSYNDSKIKPNFSYPKEENYKHPQVLGLIGKEDLILPENPNTSKDWVVTREIGRIVPLNGKLYYKWKGKKLLSIDLDRTTTEHTFPGKHLCDIASHNNTIVLSSCVLTFEEQKLFTYNPVSKSVQETIGNWSLNSNFIGSSSVPFSRILHRGAETDWILKNNKGKKIFGFEGATGQFYHFYHNSYSFENKVFTIRGRTAELLCELTDDKNQKVWPSNYYKMRQSQNTLTMMTSKHSKLRLSTGKELKYNRVYAEIKINMNTKKYQIGEYLQYKCMSVDTGFNFVKDQNLSKYITLSEEQMLSIEVVLLNDKGQLVGLHLGNGDLMMRKHSVK